MAARKSKHGYDGKIAGLYDLEDTIGRGHFAVVKLARHVFTGEKVAVKVIDKTKLDEVSRSHLFQEVRCMKLVQHPNVVRLYEVIDTQTKLYLILELGDGGDMYDYIMRHNGGLDEKVAKRYFRQIVEAISYCHKLHVVHRDLKPENVVFFEKVGLVKLTDFGFSNMFAPGKKLETSCGSLAYSAPEILLGDSYDAPAVDVWSLGVILFMLVVGEPPFQEANDSETLTMIMDCRYHVPPQISKDCKDLIGKMLQREPSKRATLSTIIAHPWLNDRDLTPMATFLPLITKEMISDEDQSYVVQKMVEGKIATRDEILQSIEKNCYDHITATYYLLIERRLRKHQQHEHHTQNQQPSSGSLRKQSAPSPSRSAKPHLEPLMLSPRTAPPYMLSWNGLFSPTFSPTPTMSVSNVDDFRQGSCVDNPDSGTSHYVQSLVSPPGTHPSTSTGSGRQLQTTPSPTDLNLMVPLGPGAIRKCSLISEESVDEYDDEDDDDMDPGCTIKPVKSMESLDEIGIVSVPSNLSLTPSISPVISPSPSSVDPVNPRRPLKSVCSSPQLLNQIHEENESEDDDDIVPMKLSMPRRFGGSSSSSREPSSASPEILRKYEQRKKRRGAGQRGTSCSSSDASDTDDTEGRSRKDKLRHKFIHRRDSSDHSSDTDGPGGNLGGNGRLGGASSGSKGSRTHNGSGGGGGGGGGSGGGGGRGSGRSGGQERKENSDNSSDNNNKNSTNNHKNSRYHGGGGGSKSSLTESSLKLLSRKLSDISNGVGALLTDCRGSDCDNDSPVHKSPSTPLSPLYKPSSTSHSPLHKPLTPDGYSSVGSGSLHRPSRNTSLKSNSSGRSGILSDSALYTVSERGHTSSLTAPKSSPVQYLGHSTDTDSICGRRQSLEFSEISSLADGESMCGASEPARHQGRKLRGSTECGNCGVSCGALHCKPSPGGVSMVPIKSKCCSVV